MMDGGIFYPRHERSSTVYAEVYFKTTLTSHTRYHRHFIYHLQYHAAYAGRSSSGDPGGNRHPGSGRCPARGNGLERPLSAAVRTLYVECDPRRLWHLLPNGTIGHQTNFGTLSHNDLPGNRSDIGGDPHRYPRRIDLGSQTVFHH